MKNLTMIANEIKANGFANYKASIVVESNKLSGWYTNKQETVCAPSLDELLFDLDYVQINIDYDNDVKSSLKLKGAFKAFLV